MFSISCLCRFADDFSIKVKDKEWSCSDGFLTRFCHCHNLCSKKLTGEALNCPPFAEWKESVPEPLLQQYQPNDIYNVDEMCFYYKRPHDHTYAFDGERVCGSKHYNSKDKLSLMLYTNMTGTDKLPPSHQQG